MNLLTRARQRAVTLRKVSRKLKIAIVTLAVVNLLVITLPTWFDYSPWQLALAMVLLDVCLYPTFRYIARRETGLPIMPVLCMSFAVQYALPILTQEPKVILAGAELRYLEESAIVVPLIMAIVGVCLLQVCYYLLRDLKVGPALPTVNLHLSEQKAEIFCIGVLALYFLMGRLRSFLPEDSALQFQSIFFLLQNQLLVAIGILAWLTFKVRKRKRHMAMLLMVVFLAALRGFSTTMLEIMIAPLAVLFIAKWMYTHRIPWVSFAMIALAFLFFSPVKMEIRQSLRGEVLDEQPVQNRAQDWVNSAAQFWGETFTGKRPLEESTADASSRMDLIHSFGHIYSLTPSEVPYQLGSTYSYLAIAWVPRLFWPEKPIANYANNFYAIEYGISTEEGVKTSSFGVTLIGEGFINFGPVGVAVIMMILGTVLSLMERTFGSERSGVGGQAILLAVFVSFLNGIGSSAEQMFGGLVQNLICSAFLIAWARGVPSIARLQRLRFANLVHGR
jgi:hypothetical protein